MTPSPLEQVSVDLIELSDLVKVYESNTFAVEQTVGSAQDAIGATRALSDLLYASAYCRPTGDVRPTSESARRELLSRMGAANRGQGTFDPGWQVIRVDADDGRYVVAKYGLMLWVEPEQCAGVQQGCSLTDTLVRVAVPKEFRELVPGFYFFFGDAIDDAEADANTTRLYWHLTEEGAVPFVEMVSSILNDAAIPFRAKVIRQPGAYVRADAGVIYMARCHVPRAWPFIRALHQELRVYLRERTPMFAQPLAPGLAVADDPGGGASFGQHRCQLVARALIDSYLDRPPTSAERLEAIVRAFKSSDLCVVRPHLRRSNAPTYPGLTHLGGDGPRGPAA